MNLYDIITWHETLCLVTGRTQKWPVTQAQIWAKDELDMLYLAAYTGIPVTEFGVLIEEIDASDLEGTPLLPYKFDPRSN